MAEEFTIALAGHCIRVTALFSATRQFCAGYETDSPADFHVTVTPEDIAFEREKSAREQALEGLRPRSFSDEYLETLAVYRKIAERLPMRNTILFHGSAIAVDDQACLFTAKSGTGKSTHTRLWRQQFGNRATMVNDDKPLLRLEESGVCVCGTPWKGKHGLGENIIVPLKAICILERSAENHIEEISLKEAYPMLVQQCYRPAEPAALMQVLSVADRIGRKVKLYRLGCNMDPSAAVTAYNGIFDTE